MPLYRSAREFSHELAGKGIRPSFQRVKVLEYLDLNQCHPTVDQIYLDLQRELPSLSRTTIYNTLRKFVEAKLVRVISIEDSETRYDIITRNHGHFKCRSCSSICNFEIDIDQFSVPELHDFQIDDKNVYFKGICPDCLTSQNNL